MLRHGSHVTAWFPAAEGVRASSLSWDRRQELSLPTLAERAFTVAAILLYMGAFMSLVTDEFATTADTSVGTPAFRVLWAAIALVTFCFLRRCPGWLRWL